jgi:hypothetical protein
VPLIGIPGRSPLGCGRPFCCGYRSRAGLLFGDPRRSLTFGGKSPDGQKAVRGADFDPVGFQTVGDDLVFSDHHQGRITAGVGRGEKFQLFVVQVKEPPNSLSQSVVTGRCKVGNGANGGVWKIGIRG